MAEELNSLESTTPNSAQESSSLAVPGQGTEGQPEGEGQSTVQEAQKINEEEYNRALKETADNKAWAHRVAQENSELRKALENINATHSRQPAMPSPDPYEKFRGLFADEATFNAFKEMQEVAARRIVDTSLKPIQSIVGNVANRTQQQMIEEEMIREYGDFAHIKPLMEKELANMPDYQKQRYTGQGYPAYESLYWRVKSKHNAGNTVNNSSAYGVAGRPTVPQRNNISDQQRAIAMEMGVDPSRVEENAKLLEQRRGGAR